MFIYNINIILPSESNSSFKSFQSSSSSNAALCLLREANNGIFFDNLIILVVIATHPPTLPNFDINFNEKVVIIDAPTPSSEYDKQ